METITTGTLSLPAPDGTATVIASKYGILVDNLSGITPEWLVKNALYGREYTTAKPNQTRVYIFNKYALKGPYTDKGDYSNYDILLTSTRNAANLFSLPDKLIVYPLGWLESQGFYYIIYPNLYAEIETGYSYGRNDQRVIRRREILPLSEVITSQLLSNLDLQPLYNCLLELYILNIKHVRLDNILVNVLSGQLYVVGYEKTRPDKLAEDVATRDKLFYFDKKPIGHEAGWWIAAFASRVVALINLGNLRTIAASDQQYQAILQLLKLSEVSTENDECLELVNISRVYNAKGSVTPNIYQNGYVTPIGTPNPATRQQVSIFTYQELPMRTTTTTVVSQKLTIPLAVASITAQTYDPIETLPLITRLPTLPFTAAPYIQPEITVVKNTGGMSGNAGNQARTYSAGKVGEVIFGYESWNVYTVGVMKNALLLYLRRGDVSNTHMAATELWRLHEIENYAGPRALFRILGLMTLEDIGLANPNLVNRVLVYCKRWWIETEKEGKLDAVINFLDILVLLEEVCASPKSRYAYESYVFFADQPIPPLIAKPHQLFVVGDPEELVTYGSLFFDYLQLKDPLSVALLTAYRQAVVDNKYKLTKRGAHTNPMIIIYQMLKILYSPDPDRIADNSVVDKFEVFAPILKSRDAAGLAFLVITYLLSASPGDFTSLPRSDSPVLLAEAKTLLSNDYNFEPNDFVIYNSDSGLVKKAEASAQYFNPLGYTLSNLLEYPSYQDYHNYFLAKLA
jgi:hypothetical protein